jgi:hypothetical protein
VRQPDGWTVIGSVPRVEVEVMGVPFEGAAKAFWTALAHAALDREDPVREDLPKEVAA